MNTAKKNLFRINSRNNNSVDYLGIKGVIQKIRFFANWKS